MTRNSDIPPPLSEDISTITQWCAEHGRSGMTEAEVMDWTVQYVAERIRSNNITIGEQPNG